MGIYIHVHITHTHTNTHTHTHTHTNTLSHTPECGDILDEEVCLLFGGT